MIIDNNELEERAMDFFREGDAKRGHELQNQFLSEVRQSGLYHCTCAAKCPHHGRCVDCVVIHRGHEDHLPACFHEMVNRKLAAVAALTETSLAK